MKVFIKNQGCPLCDNIKNLIPKDATIYDIETEEGLTEAMLYNVQSVPALVINNKIIFGQEAFEYLRKIYDNSN